MAEPEQLFDFPGNVIRWEEMVVGRAAVPRAVEGGLEIGAERIDYHPHYAAEQGENVNFKGPRELLRLLDVLVQSEGTPYKTRSDIIRDLLYYGAIALVHKMNLKDYQVESMLHAAGASADAEFIRREHRTVARLLHMRVDYCIHVIRTGDLGEVHKTLMIEWAHIMGIPLGYWREQRIQGIRGSKIMQAVLVFLEGKGYSIPAGMKR